MTVRLLLILETQGTVWVVVLLLVQQSAHHHICLPDMLIIGRKKILLFHLRIAVDEDDPAVCRLPCQQVTDVGRSYVLLVDQMATMAQFRDELAEKGYENAPEEDVLSYALFPQVAEEFFKKNLRSISTNKAKKLLGELLQIDDANELKKHLHDTLDN